MGAANLENTSSECDIRGRVGGGKWVRMKVERRREMAMNLCRAPARADKAASSSREAPYPKGQ